MTSPDSTHLDLDTIAAWADGRLGGARRAVAAEHLAACPACRQEVVEVRQIVTSYRPNMRRLRVVVPLVAVAVLALIMLLPSLVRVQRRPEPSSERRPIVETASTMSAIDPAPGASLAAGEPIEFRWHSAEPGSTYRLTLMDESGSVVWSMAGGDSATILPAEIVLERGRTYFWYVDALRADGRSVTSGAQEFSIR